MQSGNLNWIAKFHFGSFADPCRQLEFRSALSFHGKRLMNHVIRTVESVFKEFCGALCFMEPNCVSYNMEVISGSPSVTKCELNNSTHNEHPEDLKQWQNYIYRGSEVILRNKQNNHYDLRYHGRKIGVFVPSEIVCKPSMVTPIKYIFSGSLLKKKKKNNCKFRFSFDHIDHNKQRKVAWHHNCKQNADVACYGLYDVNKIKNYNLYSIGFQKIYTLLGLPLTVYTQFDLERKRQFSFRDTLKVKEQRT